MALTPVVSHCSRCRTSSLLTTRFGAVATSVVMPLTRAATLSGMSSRPGDRDIAILGAGMTPDDAVLAHSSKAYTKVPMTKTFPVYIMYFTMASDINGKMGTFPDLYSRDGAVLASFAAPRKPWTGQRQSTEKVIKLDNPL